MSDRLANDNYGRPVVLDTDGRTDTYTIGDGVSFLMTLSFPTGTKRERVYDTIHAMAPVSRDPVEPEKEAVRGVADIATSTAIVKIDDRVSTLERDVRVLQGGG